MSLSKSPRMSPTKSSTSGGPTSSGRSMDELSSFLFSFSISTPPTVSSPTSEDDSSTSKTRNARLRVPVEVLERILAYTFLRRAPLTPSSDPYPLRNTTHLLLVSKAFRELCLPFFFHSITIGRPSDYITFFQPRIGVFVAEEEGLERWKRVREICIGPNVQPKTIFPRRGKLQPASPLPPSESHIQTLCFLDVETDLEPPSTSLGLEVAERDRMERRAEDSLRLEHQRADAGIGLEQWAEASFGRSFEDERMARIFNYAEVGLVDTRRAVYRQLLQHGRQTPLLTILSTNPSRLSHLSSMINFPGLTLPVDLAIQRYVNPEPSYPSIVTEDPDPVSAFKTIFQHLVLRYVHLEGFTPEDRPAFLDQLQKKDSGPLRWLFCKETSADDGLVFVQAATLKRNHGRRRFERLSEQDQLPWRGIKSVASVEESST